MSTCCRRCDWRPDPTTDDTPAAQLAIHAIDASHPLCPSCLKSTTQNDPQHGCEHCLTDARSLLTGITTMYAELPRHLGHLRPVGIGTSRGGSDGQPLPGATTLVMLTHGSEGLAEDAETTRDNDPPSIAYELSWWALGWMDQRQEPAALLLTTNPTRTVLASAGYLERHARWAANHPSFPEFHADLKRLHAALERATGHDLPTQHANADCFDCGGQLIRRADPKTGLLDGRPVECRDCSQTYDAQRYQLALSNAWQQRIEGWVPLTDAARIAGRSQQTLHTWCSRGVVESACRVQDGRKLVWWPDVQTRLALLAAAKAAREKTIEERQAQTREAS